MQLYQKNIASHQRQTIVQQVFLQQKTLQSQIQELGIDLLGHLKHLFNSTTIAHFNIQESESESSQKNTLSNKDRTYFLRHVAEYVIISFSE
jgi:hypothetical protein